MTELANYLYASRTKEEEDVLAVKVFCVLASILAFLIASGLL